MKIAVLHLSFCVFLSVVTPETKQEVVLRVFPNKSQFSQYESVFLICEQQGNSTEWRVKRNTSRSINEECFSDYSDYSDYSDVKSHRYLDDVYPPDSGVYWCESAAGERSNIVNITVTGPFAVILESPALPVMEGDDVTLSCRNWKMSSSSLAADFSKDGVVIGSSSTGNMTIHRVSKLDEGLYRCNITGAGWSPESWLIVNAPDAPDVPAAPLISTSRLICHVVVATPYLLSTLLMMLIHKDNRRARRLVGGDRRHKVIMEVDDDNTTHR